uniref:Sentrin-specific protease 3/5 conserved domain-containing protein n=1 Tax=Esox lucius TaxID=8010 RepID=A0A3P8XY43_ESOLU
MRDSGGSFAQNHWTNELTCAGVPETSILEATGSELVLDPTAPQHVHSCSVYLRLEQHENEPIMFGMENHIGVDQEEEGFNWGEQGEDDWTAPLLSPSHHQIRHTLRDYGSPSQINIQPNEFRVRRLPRWHSLNRTVYLRTCLSLHWRTWCQWAKRAGKRGRGYGRARARWQHCRSRNRKLHSRQKPGLSRLNGGSKSCFQREDREGDDPWAIATNGQVLNDVASCAAKVEERDRMGFRDSPTGLPTIPRSKPHPQKQLSGEHISCVQGMLEEFLQQYGSMIPIHVDEVVDKLQEIFPSESFSDSHRKVVVQHLIQSYQRLSGTCNGQGFPCQL